MRCWKTRATWAMECSPRDVSPAHASSSRRSVKCPRKRDFQMQRLRRQGCHQNCRCRPRKRGHRRRFHPHLYLRLHRWKFQRHTSYPCLLWVGARNQWFGQHLVKLPTDFGHFGRRNRQHRPNRSFCRRVRRPRKRGRPLRQHSRSQSLRPRIR